MKASTVFIMVFLVIGLLGTSGCSRRGKSDLKALQGTWTGHQVGLEDQGECRFVISGDNVEMRGTDPRDWYKGTFVLRQDTDPKQLVGTIAECGSPECVGKEAHAIYKIEADTLTLAGYEPGKPNAPASFDASDARVFVLKKK